MRGSLRIVAVVLLSFSLGLHWAVLQSVGWTTMILSRAQQGTWIDALRTTFDGKHPCAICVVVKEGRSAERHDSQCPTPSPNSAPPLDLILATGTVPEISDPGESLPPIALSLSCLRRADRPPLPPPRGV